MKIAVLSDIHDATVPLVAILAKAVSLECQTIFALGDYTSPATFRQLAQPALPVFAVFGNADKNQETIEAWIKKSGKEITLRREMNRVRIGNRNLALTHFPAIAEKLLKSGMYDAVFFGHTHQAQHRWEEKTLIANPGAVQNSSFGVYESKANTFEIVEL